MKPRLPTIISNHELSQFELRHGYTQTQLSSPTSMMMGSRNALKFPRSVIERVGGASSARQPNASSQMQYSTKPCQKQTQSLPLTPQPHHTTKNHTVNATTMNYHSKPESESNWYGYFHAPEGIDMTRHGIHANLYEGVSLTTTNNVSNVATTTAAAAAAPAETTSVFNLISAQQLNGGPIEFATKRGVINNNGRNNVLLEFNKKIQPSSPTSPPASATLHDVLHSDLTSTCHFNKSRSDASLQGSHGEFDFERELGDFMRASSQLSKASNAALNKGPHEWKHTWE